MKEPEVVLEASPECVAGIVQTLKNGEKSDFTVTAARITDAGIGIGGPFVVISWETKSAGFGELTLSHKDGKLQVSTEAMSPRFVEEVIRMLAKDAVITD